MKTDLSHLRGKSQYDPIHSRSKCLASTGGSVLTMDSIGKSLSSLFRVFKLDGMPDLPPALQKLAKDNKTCLDVIGSYKMIFSIEKITGRDAVGRTFWETHKVTQIIDVVFTMGSRLLGTARYVCYLASVTFPSPLSKVKLACTCVSYSFRGYDAYHNVKKMEEELTLLVSRQTVSNTKTRTENIEGFQSKYIQQKNNAETTVAQLSREINALPTDDLTASRNEAASKLKQIDRLKTKCRRYEKYLSELNDPDTSLEKFIDLKAKKWQNRIENQKNNLSNARYSRDFTISFAANMNLILIASVFAMTNIVFLSGVALLGGAVSIEGLAGIAYKKPRKEYEII